MKLVIYGIGDLGRLMRHYFDTDSEYKTVAFCANSQWIEDNEIDELPVEAFEGIENRYPPNEYMLFVAAGYKNIRSRKRMYEESKKKGYRLANYLSSNASYEPQSIAGDNITLLSGVIVEPFAKIHSNSIINTGSVVCHHSHINAHCFIAARSLIGGFTIVGECSFIGFSSTVLQKLNLSEETLIGAGSLVNRDTKRSCCYMGAPAKHTSSHLDTGICILD